jgi:hypothetical protein
MGINTKLIMYTGGGEETHWGRRGGDDKNNKQ